MSLSKISCLDGDWKVKKVKNLLLKAFVYACVNWKLEENDEINYIIYL